MYIVNRKYCLIYKTKPENTLVAQVGNWISPWFRTTLFHNEYVYEISIKFFTLYHVFHLYKPTCWLSLLRKEYHKCFH